MLDHSDSIVTVSDKTTDDTATRVSEANKRAMDFISKSQRMVFEEAVFASNELFDRARTEMHLLSEFVSKMAGSHSVKDFRAMWEECGKHQIDFVSRDCDRLFKHGKRMIEATSKLFDGSLQS
jgi:hypothetical protein